MKVGKLYKRIGTEPLPNMNLKFGDVIFVISVRKIWKFRIQETQVKFLLNGLVRRELLCKELWEPVDIEAPL
mgnify:CR=1 FL=1